MGRKLTDKEWADPDFQALFVALEKAAIPVRQKITQIRKNRAAEPAAPETAPHSDEPSPPVVSSPSCAILNTINPPRAARNANLIPSV
jgi:hypothetical protein